MTAYDDQNIFAKILRGEIPSFKVYEDDDTLCFMDIMPRTDGHCLVIPKTPCRNVLDASDAQLAAVMATVKKSPMRPKRRLTPMASRCSNSTRPRAGRRCFTCISTSIPATQGCPCARRARWAIWMRSRVTLNGSARSFE